MDEPRDYHTKWIVRERQTSCDISYMWNLKEMIQMNWFTKQKQIHRLREQIYGYQGDRLGVWNWHVHTAIFKIDIGPTV